MGDDSLSIPLHYSKLWSLPNLRLLLVIAFVLSLLYLIVFTIFSGVRFVMINIVIMLSILILLLYGRMDPYITKRRGLAIYIMAIFAGLLHLFLKNVNIISEILATVLSATVLTFAFNALPVITRSFKRGLVGVACLLPLSSSMLYFNDVALKSLKDALIDFLLPFVLTIIGFVYMMYIEISGKKRFGLGPLSLFRAFLRLWSNKDSIVLEQALSSISTSADYTARLLVFYNDDKPIGVLLSIPIHPGPIMHMGSSNLPSEIMKKMWDEMSVVAMPFHVPSNHESDLILNDDRERVVSLIKTTIASSQSQVNEVYLTRLVEVSEDQIKVKAFLINDVPIITVTASPSPMEDLPENIVNPVKRLSRTLGLREPIIIDAHNSLSNNRSEILPEEIVGKSSIKAIEKVLTQLKQLEKKPGKISFVRTTFPGKPHEGYGEGGIAMMILEPKDEKPFYIILFDSNNMIVGLREQIINETLKIGYNGEVCTTDTHSVVALVPGGKGYNMLGENGNTSEIIKIVLDHLRNVDFKEKVSVNDINITITGLKVLGKNLYKLDEMVKKYVPKGELYPIIIFMVAMFVTVLFNII
ncbi:MAG: DUF2070 family protein [Thermoprotei archaeon]